MIDVMEQEPISALTVGTGSTDSTEGTRLTGSTGETGLTDSTGLASSTGETGLTVSTRLASSTGLTGLIRGSTGLTKDDETFKLTMDLCEVGETASVTGREKSSRAASISPEDTGTRARETGANDMDGSKTLTSESVGGSVVADTVVDTVV